MLGGMTMKIGGVSGASPQAGQAGMQQGTDAVSRDIQRQIAETQKKLQELSSNKEMSVEEKMKKRQELQKKITDLNNQLKQHQIELRKEKQQQSKKGTAMDDMLGGRQQAEGPKGKRQQAGMSKAGMAAMITADSSMKQAQAQGRVATNMKGQAGILRAEISQDAKRGVNVEKKQEELSDLEHRLEDTTASQVSSMADAAKVMKDAAEDEAKNSQGVKEEQEEKKEKAKKEEKEGVYVDVYL